MRRSWCLLPMLVVASGCLKTAVDGLGHRFVVGARNELADTTTRQRIRSLIDSALADLGKSYRAQVFPLVDTSLQSVRESLATALETRLSAALDSLVRHTVRAAGAEGGSQLTELTRHLRWELDHQLSPALETSVQTATRSFMHELSAGLRTELRIAAESALAAVVRTGVRQGSQEVQRSPVGKSVVWIAVGIAGAILALAAAWVIRDRRQRGTALNVVLDEVQRLGNPTLDAAIASRAADHRVERYVAPPRARRQR